MASEYSLPFGHDPASLDASGPLVDENLTLKGGRNGKAQAGGSSLDKALCLARMAGIETWRDEAGEPHLTVPIKNHVEHYRLKADLKSPAGLWLADYYFRSEGKALPSGSRTEVLENLMAEAMSSDRVFVTGRRVARLGNHVFVDLCNPTWEVVEVTPQGWAVRAASEVPIRFTHAPSMLALPYPLRGGQLEDLRPFFNCDDDGFRLIVAWILTGLSGGGEYPILVLGGEAGSAKSTATRYVRALVDPNTAPLRKMPREERDLFIAAKNSLVLTLDNLSTPPAWLSDALCAIALGTSFACRTLYADEGETIFSVASPIVMNGITEQLTRSDLADRAFSVTLHRIPQESMRPKNELDAAFNEVMPSVLGAFLDVLSSALAHLADVSLDRYPRLAQTAKFMAAAEPSLGWEPGTFAQLLERTHKSVAESVLEGDPTLQALQAQVQSNGGQWLFTGTATNLLGMLEEFKPYPTPKKWPSAANKLTLQLRVIASQLRLMGWEVSVDGRDGTRKNGRCIRLSFPASIPSFSPEEMERPSEASDRPKLSDGEALRPDDHSESIVLDRL